MKKLLPPVLFLLTIAVLAVIAYQSRTVHNQTDQATQTTLKQQQTAIQSAKAQLEEVQKIRAVPETSTPGPTPIKPSIKMVVPAPTPASEKTAEITKRIETAHTALAAPAATTPATTQQPATTDAQTIDLYMPLVVTAIVGLAALYIILSKKFDADSLKWAYGILGTIVGFWLKSQ
jgi:Tfp pilus assembly protein PilV